MYTFRNDFRHNGIVFLPGHMYPPFEDGRYRPLEVTIFRVHQQKPIEKAIPLFEIVSFMLAKYDQTHVILYNPPLLPSTIPAGLYSSVALYISIKQ